MATAAPVMAMAASMSRFFQDGSQPKPWVSTCCFRDLQGGSRSGASRRLSCRASSSWSQGAERSELPEKLQEIVRVFQGVTEPRAKCEQLLHYAAKLKPLAEEQKQPENKVEGCVSKVYIVCEFNEADGRVYFEAESDVMLTKGLAGLLVEGLSGVTVEEVLKVTPDFVHMLGLKQSLTPSRSNGFLNMLKLIQKKTLQVYSNATPTVAGNATVPITSIDPHNDLPHLTPSPGGSQTTKHLIEKKLTEGLTPVQLEVQDVSHEHAGHEGGPRGSPETHFHVKVVSEQFQGRSLLKRHRLVYELLQAELREGSVHALSICTKTPTEVAAQS
ncbi:hypothetical protein M758_8G047200 [Ceratodon purpureus]|nr:hypothetical protein M758_8G047200 [Ceratodon purpureus]